MEKILTVGDYSVELNDDIVYDLFGDEVRADQLLEVDFSHVKFWFHQKQLIHGIRIFNAVPVHFHHSVLKSLMVEAEGSQYWGKDVNDAFTMFKREQLKDQTDIKQKRAMAAGADMSLQANKNKKHLWIKALVKMGYDKTTAREALEYYINDTNGGIMNLPKEVVMNKIEHYLGVLK